MQPDRRASPDYAELEAAARASNDNQLAEWLQREADQVRRDRRWQALRHWLFVGAAAALLIGAFAWGIAGWIQWLSTAAEVAR
jgi:hypothetical protein